jgi:hypothetical protein
MIYLTRPLLLIPLLLMFPQNLSAQSNEEGLVREMAITHATLIDATA